MKPTFAEKRVWIKGMRQEDTHLHDDPETWEEVKVIVIVVSALMFWITVILVAIYYAFN